jgi:hypothetical protein
MEDIHAGAPTRPVPTSISPLFIEPTFRGFLVDRVSSYMHKEPERCLLVVVNDFLMIRSSRSLSSKRSDNRGGRS